MVKRIKTIRKNRKNQPQINSNIRAKSVLLIDKNGENQGITETQAAVAQAKSVGLDLVVVAPRNDDEAPVAKILDYGKQQYQKKKRQSKSNSSKPSLKEVKLRPNVDDSDYGIRIKRAMKWLDKGNMVKFQVRLRGREHQHRDRAYDLLNRIVEDLDQVSEVQSFDKRSLIVQVSPA